MDLSSWGLRNADRADLIRLMLQAEDALDAKRIDECFELGFFATKFWLMWCSMFGLFPDLETMQTIRSTRYSGYDSIARPLVRWLEEQGVRFETGVQVTDLQFASSNGTKAVRRISCLRDGRPSEIEVGESDLVIVTIGSMSSVPAVKTETVGGSWALWKRLAEKDRAFVVRGPSAGMSNRRNGSRSQ